MRVGCFVVSLRMCVSPRLIKNPNLGLVGPNAQFKDTVSQYIRIPCGTCPQCIAARQMQFVQRLQMEALVNHIFMCSITYNNDMLPVVGTSTGYSIRYGAVSDVQNMFKRLRKRNAFGRPFRHFSVYELGSKKGRPHFHILFLIPKKEGDELYDCYSLEKLMFREVLSEWKRNVAPQVWSFKKKKFIPNTAHPVYKPCCTYVRRLVRGKWRSNYDLHYVNPSLTSGAEADVAFYVLKYMMKPSDRAVRLRRALHLNLPEDEYDEIWSLVKPRHFESEGFGLGTSAFDWKDGRKVYRVDSRIYEHLRKGLDLSKTQSDEPSPLFFSPVDGKGHPLARFYRNNGDIYSMSDFLDFFYASKINADNVVFDDPDDWSQSQKMIDDFQKKVDDVDFQQTASEMDDLFDSDFSDFLDF